MPTTSFKQFLRRIKVLKPCPVKHYRKEDLDFIFNLYNTDHFTQPFEAGQSLTVFFKAITQLFENLKIHRNPDDDQNSHQANIVFYNLKALLKLEILPVYETSDWKCLAMDALRFNCSEAINDLLAEYEYSDHIHNDRLYTHTPLHVSATGQDEQTDRLPYKIKEVKHFLSAQKLPPVIADDYFNMVHRHAAV